MPVLAKFDGIVIRMLTDPTFGMRLNACYGDSELVIGLHPLRLIQREVPDWEESWVLNWVRQHEHELQPPAGRDARHQIAAARQAA